MRPNREHSALPWTRSAATRKSLRIFKRSECWGGGMRTGGSKARYRSAERYRPQIHEGSLFSHLVLEHADGREWVMEDVGAAVKAPVSLLCDMLSSLFREEGKRTCSVSLEADTSTVRTVLFLGIDLIKKRSFYFRKQKKHEFVLILAQKKGLEQPNRLPVPYFKILFKQIQEL